MPMRVRMKHAVAALLLLATSLADAASPDAMPYNFEDAMNIITVSYKPGASESSVSLAAAAAEKFGVPSVASAAPSPRRRLGEKDEPETKLMTVQIAQGVDPSEIMTSLSQQPEVASVTFNEWWNLVPGLESPLDSDIADDTSGREDLWSMEKIGAPTVWSRIESMDRREVKVCVIDSG